MTLLKIETGYTHRYEVANLMERMKLVLLGLNDTIAFNNGVIYLQIENQAILTMDEIREDFDLDVELINFQMRDA